MMLHASARYLVVVTPQNKISLWFWSLFSHRFSLFLFLPNLKHQIRLVSQLKLLASDHIKLLDKHGVGRWVGGVIPGDSLS